ncbi:MAG TPA: hypothetical protein DDY20_12365 [Desulfobulbaceae bacterium]|nr:hypothetical protein [Desulfobulbaceae bacterium]
MKKKSILFGSCIIFILISVLNTVYAKADLLLTMPPLLAASAGTDHIAGCYSGNFTDNCLGDTVNGIIGVAINADRSFSTLSIFGVESSGKFTEKIHNTYSGSGQTDATGCGSYDITCTDLGYSISCNYKYANGKTGAIPDANQAQCMPANKFLIQSLAGSWNFPQLLYLNINTVHESPPGSGNYSIDGCDSAGRQLTVSKSSDNTYHFADPECPGGRYCPWFEFNYISTNTIEGRHCFPGSCYPFYSERFSPTVSTLAAARSDHTATLLADGRVLVAGGYGYANSTIESTVNPEIYYPAAKIWSLATPLAAGRSNHTATLLADGRVLVAGGYRGAFLNSAELYDPSTNTWSAASQLAAGRGYHTATLLADGRVLVAGGHNNTESLVIAELYDPSTNTWSAAGSLTVARFGHTATLLADGRVLVAGGEHIAFLDSAELYDPATNTWSAAGSLTVARSHHTATLLADGRVLVAGGQVGWEILGDIFTESAELYDPAANTWSAAGNLAAFQGHHTATLLPDGRVLVAGGVRYPGNSAELYDPAANTWSAAGNLTVGRFDHTATLLPDGQVLVTGGEGEWGRLAITELYDPASDSWFLAENFAAAGNGHTAALLPDSRSGSQGGMAAEGIPYNAE